MLQHVSTVWHRFLTHHCNVSERAEFCTICCLYLRFHGTVPWCKLLAMRSAALVSISCNHDETGKIKPGVILTTNWVFSVCRLYPWKDPEAKKTVHDFAVAIGHQIVKKVNTAERGGKWSKGRRKQPQYTKLKKGWENWRDVFKCIVTVFSRKRGWSRAGDWRSKTHTNWSDWNGWNQESQQTGSDGRESHWRARLRKEFQSGNLQAMIDRQLKASAMRWRLLPWSPARRACSLRLSIRYWAPLCSGVLECNANLLGILTGDSK